MPSPSICGKLERDQPDFSSLQCHQHSINLQTLLKIRKDTVKKDRTPIPKQHPNKSKQLQFTIYLALMNLAPCDSGTQLHACILLYVLELPQLAKVVYFCLNFSIDRAHRTVAASTSNIVETPSQFGQQLPESLCLSSYIHCS
ncbi:hypothetical protein RRG08_022335 [Elysia crispata]|uniref:Uncharacterized protein n=1 Tax=Elysia crispata TaxID=231223 RepID=A0AAE0Z1B0_9GAST|nr:hypothetical protein RRG08_022335 [Elysia crispata]